MGNSNFESFGHENYGRREPSKFENILRGWPAKILMRVLVMNVLSCTHNSYVIKLDPRRTTSQISWSVMRKTYHIGHYIDLYYFYSVFLLSRQWLVRLICSVCTWRLDKKKYGMHWNGVNDIGNGLLIFHTLAYSTAFFFHRLKFKTKME